MSTHSGLQVIERLDGDDVERVRLSVRSFGFGLLSGMIVPSVLRQLQDEARQRLPAALVAEQLDNLQYRAKVVPLGPRMRDFLCSAQLLDLLCAVFDSRFVLTEQRSCLTFYQDGDHLGAHLDQPAEECVVTIIIYLAADGPRVRSSATGLQLRLYGETMPEDRTPTISIPTHTGGMVIGHGSKFWHERPMLQVGERVTAITGCYGNASDSASSDPASTPAADRTERQPRQKRPAV